MSKSEELLKERDELLTKIALILNEFDEGKIKF